MNAERLSIMDKIINCIDSVGFYNPKIYRVIPEPNTKSDYLVVFESPIDNRVRKCIINGNEANNCFDYKYSLN